MCRQVNGERDPAEVYSDFRAAVLHILGTDMMSALQPPQHGEWPAPSMDPNALPMTRPPAVPTTGPAPRGPPGGVAYPPVIWVIGEQSATGTQYAYAHAGAPAPGGEARGLP